MKNVTAKPMPSADNSSGVPKERILSNPHAGLQSMDPATGSAEVTQTSTPLPSVQTIPQSQSSREFQNVLLKQGQENMPQSSGMQTVAEIPVADSAILDRFTPPLAASFQERRFHPVREVEVHYDMAMKVAENANSNIAAAFNDVRSFRNPTTVELNALSSVTPWSWNRPAATPETQIPSEATVSANPKSQPASVPTSSDSSAQTATGQTPNRSQAANSVFPTPGARQSTEADLAVPQRYLHPAMVPGSTTVAAFEGTSSPSNALGGNSAMSPMASLSAEVMVQVIEHGKLLRSGNLDEVTLQLKPEILGKVAIKASLENGQLSTRISVENIQIAQFLSDHANWLRNSMGPVEIQVVSFDHSNASLPAPSFNYKGSSQGDVPAHRGIQPRRRAGTQRTTEPESVTEAATVPSSTRLDLHL
jgi:flagellar hook-length control protein FliK